MGVIFPYMARLTQKKSDLALASSIVSKYQAAAFARRPREEEWWKARKRYEPSWVDKAKVKRAPYVKNPYVYRTTNNQTSRLLRAARANGQYAVVRSSTPEHGAVGEIVGNFVERQFRRKGASLRDSNPRALKMLAHGGKLYGNGILHLCWYESDYDWGVRFQNIDLFDVFPDWKDYRWIVLRRRVTVAEIGDIVRTLSAPSGEKLGEDPETGEAIYSPEPSDGGRAQKAFDKILKMVKKGHRNISGRGDGLSDDPRDKQIELDRIDDNYDSDDGLEVPDDPFNVQIEVLEYYETRHDGIIAKIVPGFGDGEDLVLQKGVNPYGVCPLVPFTPSPIDSEFWGFGVGEIVGPLAEAMDYMLRSQLRLVAKNADAPLLHRRSLRLSRQFLASPTGASVEVDDITNAIGYLAPNHDQGLYSFALGLSQEVADMATGSSASQRGQASGSKTATANAIAEEGGQVNTDLEVDEWGETLEQIARVIVAMAKVHITEEKAIPLVGRNADAFVALRPEYLTGTFEIEYGGARMDMTPSQELTAVLNYAQTFGPSGVANIPYLAREAARKSGANDPDRWVVAGAAKPKVSPRSENSMVFTFGMDIEVHPEDDDMAHMTAHQRDLQRVAQEDPSHPGIAKMVEHLGQHQFAMQQKQMAQMQPQGSGGMGGSPMSMDGGQGNMAGPQRPRSGDVDAMRQQSNNAANGAAPGGATVANRPVGGIAYGGPSR